MKTTSHQDYLKLFCTTNYSNFTASIVNEVPYNWESLFFLAGRTFVKTGFAYAVFIVQTLCANPVLTVTTDHLKPGTQAYHTVKSEII